MENALDRWTNETFLAIVRALAKGEKRRHSIIGWSEYAYLEELRYRVSFWLGLMFSITDEADCSATNGVSEELAVETGGENDE